LRRRDLRLLALAADLAVPPLGMLALANVALGTVCLIHMAVTGATAPFGLAVLANALFAFSLGAAWYICGRDLVGGKEIGQLPKHVLMVMHSVLSLARGQTTNWIRADRLRATIQLERDTRRNRR
jgi:hypothetical protein